MAELGSDMPLRAENALMGGGIFEIPPPIAAKSARYHFRQTTPRRSYSRFSAHDGRLELEATRSGGSVATVTFEREAPA